MKEKIEVAKKHILKDIANYSNGATVSKIIAKTMHSNLTVFAFDKGQNLSEHTAPFDAMVQILDGTAKIIIDKKPHILNEGDIIMMPANIPHALEAEERFKMLLTMLKV